MSTMLFGAVNARSVLGSDDFKKGMEVEAIEVADAS